jgi:hypothetical protein
VAPAYPGRAATQGRPYAPILARAHATGRTEEHR